MRYLILARLALAALSLMASMTKQVNIYLNWHKATASTSAVKKG